MPGDSADRPHSDLPPPVPDGVPPHEPTLPRLPADESATRNVPPRDELSGSPRLPADESATRNVPPRDELSGSPRLPADESATRNVPPRDELSGSPRLPADESATRNVPPRDELSGSPRLPADESATRNVTPRDELSGSPRLPADESATRNVPPRDEPAGSAPSDRLVGEHLPTRNVPPPPTPVVETVAPDEVQEFVLPDIEPMGPATTALLVGRLLFAVAALLVGLAARRSTGVGGEVRSEAFWPVVTSAGVLTVVGLAGLVFWSVTVAGNARRLRARSASARTMGWSWAFPVAWVVFSALTYLQIDVDAEIDPLPGLAAVGWMLTMTIPYGRLQGVFRSLSRRPPILWITAFPIDVLAFGLVWWRLTSWPSPIGQQRDHVELTALIAFGAAAALAINALVFAWLAQRAGNGMYERLGRLEALHHPDAGRDPEWFRVGLDARQRLAPPVVARPLIATRKLASVVAACHVLWGVLLVGSGILVAALAVRYSGESVFAGDELAVDDADVDRVVVVGAVVVLSYVAAVLAHGIWAALTAINARRVTVHSPNPGTFVAAFAPTPLLLVAGLLVGGPAGYLLAAVGLTIGYLAMTLVNQMLVALSGRIGRQLLGFSRWTLCLMLAYVVGFVMNLLFSQAASQLGVYAFLLIVQGALIVTGGVIGHSAMQAIEDELRNHRRVQRTDIA